MNSKNFYLTTYVGNCAYKLAVIKAVQAGNKIDVLCKVVLPGGRQSLQDASVIIAVNVILDNIENDTEVSFYVQGTSGPAEETNAHQVFFIEKEEVPECFKTWKEIPFRFEETKPAYGRPIELVVVADEEETSLPKEVRGIPVKFIQGVIFGLLIAILISLICLTTVLIFGTVAQN